MINIEFEEKTFDDVSMFGDNTDRTNDIMQSPSLGQESIVRYKVPNNKKATIKGIGISCDFGALLLSGAYTTAQNGAIIAVRFDSTNKFEQKFNWTGLSGYIGGADDYNAENEIMLSGYDTPVDAGTVIDVYVTGGTNVRRMYYVSLYGVLDDGTPVFIETKQAVDGTTATSIALYTVPAGRILYLKQLVISARHIDLYAGKGYLVYNGFPVMAIDIMQTELGGVYGLYLPFYGVDIPMSASLGIRVDSFECGNEVIAAAVYADETDVSGGGGGFPVVGNTGLVR